MMRAVVAVTLTALPAAAQDATSWLAQGINMPSDLHVSGPWHPRGGQIFATDPLTLWQTGLDVETITVPDTPARVVGLLETEEGRTAVMALIWSDAPVICGDDLTTIAVDTGLAAFLTPSDVAALDAYAHPSDGPYHATYAQQLDAVVPTIPFIVALPDGTRFPISGTGWGDGGYPVASLYDADGNMVALYAQFMGGAEEWHLPTPCTDQTS